MKRVVLVSLALLVMSTGFLFSAESKANKSMRFYGTVTSVDVNQNSLSLFNKKRKLEENFQWTNNTKMVSNKKSIGPDQFKEGQFLIVSYKTIDNSNIATRITIRKSTPRKKK